MTQSLVLHGILNKGGIIMNYAIELVFDEEGQIVINSVRNTLVQNGVHDEAIKLNHISIGDYKTD